MTSKPPFDWKAAERARNAVYSSDLPMAWFIASQVDVAIGTARAEERQPSADERMAAEAKRAVRAGDFATARDIQSSLAAGDPTAQLLALAVGRLIDRAREQQERAA